jgi:hypothetical protein
MKKIFRVSNGVLEEVTVLNEHYMQDGASVETYLCRSKQGGKFVCSKDMYFETKEKAWADELEGLQQGLLDAIESIKNATKLKEDIVKRILRVEKELFPKNEVESDGE